MKELGYTIIIIVSIFMVFPFAKQIQFHIALINYVHFVRKTNLGLIPIKTLHYGSVV